MSLFTGDADQKGFEAYCRMNQTNFVSGCIITFLPEKRDGGRLQKSLLAKLPSIIEGLCVFLATVNEYGLVVMLFLPKEIEADRLKTWCGETAEIIEDGLEKETGVQYLYCIGNIYNSFSRMRDSYLDSISQFSEDPASDGLFRDSADKVDDYAKLAKDYIGLHYTEDISLGDCAQRIGISPYYLSHIFKDRTGKNFVEYLSEVRIDAAKRLCRDETLSVKEIAGRCGYANITYFYRVFKKATGVTVGEYRREMICQG